MDGNLNRIAPVASTVSKAKAQKICNLILTSWLQSKALVIVR